MFNIYAERCHYCNAAATPQKHWKIVVFLGCYLQRFFNAAVTLKDPKALKKGWKCWKRWKCLKRWRRWRSVELSFKALKKRWKIIKEVLKKRCTFSHGGAEALKKRRKSFVFCATLQRRHSGVVWRCSETTTPSLTGCLQVYLVVVLLLQQTQTLHQKKY